MYHHRIAVNDENAIPNTLRSNLKANLQTPLGIGGKSNVQPIRRQLLDVTNATPAPITSYKQTKQSARAQVAERRKSGVYAPTKPTTSISVNKKSSIQKPNRMMHPSLQPELFEVEYMPPTDNTASTYQPSEVLHIEILLRPDNPDCYRFRRCKVDEQLEPEEWIEPCKQHLRNKWPEALFMSLSDEDRWHEVEMMEPIESSLFSEKVIQAQTRYA
jgi:hypothetical protein